MTNRAQAKKQTRQRLLRAAKQEFVAQGMLKISTVDIARGAGVAHGTLFFHFQTKENLVEKVLDNELLKISAELGALLHGSSGVEGLLNTYLDFLEREEEFFVVLARETPLYPPTLRRIILGRECAIRQYFYQALQSAIEQGQCKEVDITTVLNFLFGTLNYYLSLRDSFAGGQSVINAKRRTIVSTFIQLLSK